MAGKSKSARYYQENPAARRVKARKDTEINRRPSQVKKRTELNKANRERGTYGNGDKMDLSHTTKGLVKKPQSVNRGSKKDQPGDKRARGGK